jgi:hypothetical protein
MSDRACHPLVQRQLGWSGFNVAFGQWLIRVQLLARTKVDYCADGVWVAAGIAEIGSPASPANGE